MALKKTVTNVIGIVHASRSLLGCHGDAVPLEMNKFIINKLYRGKHARVYTKPTEEKEEGPETSDSNKASKCSESLTSNDADKRNDESFYEECEEGADDDFLKYTFKDFIVDPTGEMYYAWQGAVGVSVFYNIIFTILRIAFEQLKVYWWAFWLADVVTDFIYALDMVVQMSISYIDDGIYVTDKEQLKENYLKTKKFSNDAISILPLPYVAVAFKGLYCLLRRVIGLTDIGISSSFNEITLLGFLRLPRLLKYDALSKVFSSMESRTNSPDSFRAFKLIVYLLIIIHWIACVYYSISWYEGFGVNEWVYPASEDGEEEHNFLRKYTVCFYWSFLTLTTIGGGSDPVTNLEYLFTGLTFFNGVFVFAAVVGNVGDVISNMNAARTEFQAKMDDIKRYMVHHRVPDSLQRRVKKWFDYSWGRTHGVDESSLLETLPDKLRARIQIQIHLKTLKKVTIFENCENGLLCELVLKLRPQIFSPKDYVCRRNEIGKEMYIINHGKLECIVTTETGERIVVATLTEGKYFGEIALLSFEGNNRRTADVRSVGYSELLVLSKKALMSALVDYPEARKQLEIQAQLRIISNRKINRSLKNQGSTASHSVSNNGERGERSDKRSRSGDSIESKAMREARQSELREMSALINELKSFDCITTQKRVAELEEKCEDLKENFNQKSKEYEAAVVKLRLLEMNNTPDYSGGLARLKTGTVDEKLSPHTLNILQNLRKQRSHNLSSTFSKDITPSISRKTSTVEKYLRHERTLPSTSYENGFSTHTRSEPPQYSPCRSPNLRSTSISAINNHRSLEHHRSMSDARVEHRVVRARADNDSGMGILSDEEVSAEEFGDSLSDQSDANS